MQTRYALLCALFGAFSVGCYPGEIQTAAQTDLVATFHKKDADFKANKTFAMPDSIVDIGVAAGHDTSFNHAHDAEILAKVAGEFVALGYTRVDLTNPPTIKPNAVVLVPQYILTERLGWLSTYQGLIVPEAATTFAFGVFLLRQFFLTLPAELEDAARIDGAGPWRIFTRIVLPLSQPVLGALAIFAFRSAWNDFLWPLIAVNKPEMFPLPVALALLRSAYSSESYGPIMAGATLSALPLLIVFLVANRRIVEGVRVSGLKG